MRDVQFVSVHVCFALINCLKKLTVRLVKNVSVIASKITVCYHVALFLLFRFIIARPYQNVNQNKI